MSTAPEPWTIEWYICHHAGRELWRVPLSIGPVSVEHSHWAGMHLAATQADVALIAEAPLMFHLLKVFRSRMLRGREPVDSIDALIARVEAAQKKKKGT